MLTENGRRYPSLLQLVYFYLLVFSFNYHIRGWSPWSVI